jgi:hypothetical protein
MTALAWADQAGSKLGVLSSGPWMVSEIVRARGRLAWERRREAR